MSTNPREEQKKTITAGGQNKKHVSIATLGHIDAGKSTTTGHLLFKLGGIDERTMQKLSEEAEIMGKGSFKYAFFCDKQKEERERGITITIATKEFFTNNFHYTIVDCPGHQSYIKNMISGASQVDVAMLMVPADGGFTTAIAKANHKAAQVQGQTRQHANLALLLGIKQLIVCVNKMDCETAKYSQERFEEIRDEMRNMLVQVGWNKKFVMESVPILPISGFQGDNLIDKSDKMPWWKGTEVKAGDETCTVTTVYDALDNYVKIPKRSPDLPLRMPVSGIHKIKGVGDVITGRIEQGTVSPGAEVIFVPSYFTNKSAGKVFTVEMHHKSVPQAETGDNVGLNIKGLTKETMPKSGDIMILKNDSSLKKVAKFTAQVQVLEHPNELQVGFCPIGFVRTAHAACKLSKIVWKMGKDTNNQKVQDPTGLKSKDMAEVIFEPTMPFTVETFAKCEGLGRIAFMDSNTVIMLGKITDVEYVD
ncbi:MAG: elongation factor 1 alpha long form [Edafosvirus sp.]|uniref:Elongation factor 1 alpha long form n=1 Tax=Edafosvirus sp. TaxID=2487765 RepID=A0A3G4ZUM2_9VIRU|nr:MAG: elongation factor 1 alpha long form [Edafosvirus sp.]